MNLYLKLSSQRVIFPYYHTVVDSPKPHLSELGYFRIKGTFINDINFFLTHYRHIGIKDIGNANGNSFHLSFDDGLSEIWTHIAPILLSNNLMATFFINSDFIDNKNLFYRHKISLIINQLKSSPHYIERVSHYFSIDESKVLTYVDKLNNINIIDEIAQKIDIDFKGYLNDCKPYLTLKQLKELKKMGFTIANHGKNHANFNTLNFQAQKKQIEEVNSFLNTNMGVNNYYFSFPFGDHDIKNDFFEWIYQEGNILLSFGVSGIKSDYFEKHLHRIPMEFQNYSAKEIIKFEYFYYLIKAFLGKNKIRRKY